ncbi:MAG TPA: deoxyribodipyrimidine photo-lyase [Polyangiaceae bacterium]|nr:deoxyribodipyrimidine photo-lyase [Polyangiaceae bacterium]
MSSRPRTLVWFRGKDLRLDDHAPLAFALARGDVVPLFVLDPYFFAPERARRLPHRMQFLLESLAALAMDIEQKGSRLLVVAGKSVEVVPELVRRLRIDHVVGERWCEPVGRRRDRLVAEALRVPFELLEGETLCPPGALRNQEGKPYSVFTAFARAFAVRGVEGEPLDAPARLPAPPRDVDVETVPIPTCEELGIARNPRILPAGETAAKARLGAFIAGPAARYDELRDRLDLDATSRLSVDLKFGTLSPRRVWHAVRRALARSPKAWTSFANELVWREFTHSTLWDFPHVLREPYRPAWAAFPWRDDEAGFRAWASGTTGYPVVDAAARQLASVGFVPNRARMIAASFLTKHLLVDYRRGEAHYLELLTDGDFANNNAGWQWSAGCGQDAQPYFRVFNPTTQGKKFDPDGDYVRRWVPELAQLPAAYIHCPSEAPPNVLGRAGVTLGTTYPRPIVDHAEARARFLAVAESAVGPAGRGRARP